MNGYPADQLIRNARIGLWRTGWYQESRLFPSLRRDFVLLLVNATGTHPLVDTYRDPIQLAMRIPKVTCCRLCHTYPSSAVLVTGRSLKRCSGSVAGCSA